MQEEISGRIRFVLSGQGRNMLSTKTLLHELRHPAHEFFSFSSRNRNLFAVTHLHRAPIDPSVHDHMLHIDQIGFADTVEISAIYLAFKIFQ